MRRFRDSDDPRTLQLIDGYDDAAAFAAFPDFAVACRRAASSEGGCDGLRDASYDVLLEGLGVCKVKSTILWALCGNRVFNGDGVAAFEYGVQAFHATRSIPSGPGDHVYAFFFLYYVFALLGEKEVTERIAMNHPGIELPRREVAEIELLAERTYPLLSAATVAEAAAVVKEALPRRSHTPDFPIWYADDAPLEGGGRSRALQGSTLGVPSDDDLAQVLDRHRARMHAEPGLSGSSHLWGVLFSEPILSYISSSMRSEVDLAASQGRHGYEAKLLKGTYVVISAIPSLNPLSMRAAFPGGYLQFLDKLMKECAFTMGGVNLAHWLIGFEGEVPGIHLTYLPSAEEMQRGLGATLAQDLLTELERRQVGMDG